ncbi:MAG: hypothetical protein PF574_01860 [Candidatus Delongbacteria bacterium]|jgi:opacity protein-like surface antigen|nr:hypothetical protein [Candidatus Delongbacteria bacterium]
MKNIKTLLISILILVVLEIPLYSKDNKGFDLHFRTNYEYNDNIYSLSASQKLTYNENNSEDDISGRYEDMNSLSDNIITPEIGLGYIFKNPLGGKFKLSSVINYNYFIENEKKSHPEFSIKMEQTVSKHSEINLEIDYIYGFFNKNYLCDITDLAGPNIGKDERIYSAGIYDEFEGTLDSKYSFDMKNKELFISGINLKPYFGGSSRKYNSEFSNRDKDILFAGLSFDIDVLSYIEFSAGYEYDLISSPGEEELILFDEIEYGTDVNGDFTLRANAPFFTEIDRSADKHNIEIGTKFEILKSLKLDLGYEYARTVYSSDNKLDLNHYDQTENSWQAEVSMQYKFSKNLTSEIEYKYENEIDADDGRIITRSISGKLKYNL